MAAEGEPTADDDTVVPGFQEGLEIEAESQESDPQEGTSGTQATNTPPLPTLFFDEDEEEEPTALRIKTEQDFVLEK